MSKKKGQKGYEKGLDLENQVARWLKSQFGCEVKKREFMRGSVAKRPYEIDVHGSSDDVDVWVECKVDKIKRTHVAKLVESARDVRDAVEIEIEEWYPDMLMLVSSKGFDVDAIGMANKYSIYCVKAGETFQFMGEMDREDFENDEGSEY